MHLQSYVSLLLSPRLLGRAFLVQGNKTSVGSFRLTMYTRNACVESVTVLIRIS